jgi:hypothetical protein
MALGQALSQVSGTVKESRHDDPRGDHVRSITSDATHPSATTAPHRFLQFAMKYLF